MTPRLLTLAEAADQLHVSERTVQRIIGRGELAIVRIGRQIRVRQADLDAYVAAQRIANNGEAAHKKRGSISVLRPRKDPGSGQSLADRLGLR